jgi:hypothetical protein
VVAGPTMRCRTEERVEGDSPEVGRPTADLGAGTTHVAKDSRRSWLTAAIAHHRRSLERDGGDLLVCTCRVDGRSAHGWRGTPRRAAMIDPFAVDDQLARDAEACHCLNTST